MSCRDISKRIKFWDLSCYIILENKNDVGYKMFYDPKIRTEMERFWKTCVDMLQNIN